MNLTITGKKIASQPQKRSTIPLSIKIKKQEEPKKIIKTFLGKPSLPPKNIQNQIKTQNKKPNIKKESKKDTKKEIVPKQKLQAQVKELKIQKNNQEQANNQVNIEDSPLIKQETKFYEIIVRYNHYKDKFPVEDDVLRYEVIENKYAFGGVFKGNYQPRLQVYRNYGNYLEPSTSGTAMQYSWNVQEGKQYEITIAEDEEEENKYERKVYIAPKQQKKCQFKKNQRVEELTKQMRQMSIQELGSAKHKELLEQRALEQVLYS